MKKIPYDKIKQGVKCNLTLWDEDNNLLMVVHNMQACVLEDGTWAIARPDKLFGGKPNPDSPFVFKKEYDKDPLMCMRYSL